MSRLGSVDGSWCRDARTAERLYTGFRAGQGCHPGLRVGVRSILSVGRLEGKGGDTLCVI